jgi:hypothetical protein
LAAERSAAAANISCLKLGRFAIITGTAGVFSRRLIFTRPQRGSLSLQSGRTQLRQIVASSSMVI